METIVVKRKHSPEEDDKYLRKFVETSWIHTWVDTTTRVVREDGTVLCILLKAAIPMDMVKPMYSAIHKKIGSTNNRGDASGAKAIRVIKKDGTRSNTQRTEFDVKSSLMGFFDRYPRFPYCRQTAYNEKYPQLFHNCLPALRKVNDLFKEHMPERYAAQLNYCNRTAQDFLIPGTVFTTITLNKNFRTACHRDAGDLKAGFGCMSYMRSGKFDGGELCFPQYGAGLRLETGDLVLFDPHEVHGNTEIRAFSKDWERLTCVHYYREKMYYCGTAAQELDRAKRHGAKGSGTMNINWNEGINETDANEEE